MAKITEDCYGRHMKVGSYTVHEYTPGSLYCYTFGHFAISYKTCGMTQHMGTFSTWDQAVEAARARSEFSKGA